MVKAVIFVNLFLIPFISLYIVYKWKQTHPKPNMDLLFQYCILAACNIPLTKVFGFFIRRIGISISIDSGYYTLLAIVSAAVLPSLLNMGRAAYADRKTLLQKGKMSLQKEKFILCIFVFAFIIYSFHWKFELPNYPFVDETLITNPVLDMLKSIYAPLPFTYPHLAMYVGYFAYKIVSLFINIESFYYYYFIRIIICGTALLSNLCMYFAGKRITGRKRYGYICLLISLFSFYQFDYLWYSGPDVMLYAVSNVIFLVAIEMYYLEDEMKALKLYPVIAILIGLAMSAKYHGVLLGALWLSVHVAKGYFKDFQKNKVFLGNCFLIVASFLICNWKIFMDPKGFITGFAFNFTHYAAGHIGIEHNIPLLGYVEAWILCGFGLFGAIIFVFGIIYCFRHKDYKKLSVVLLVVPVIVLFVLSRSVITLGRNIALIMPVFYFFEMLGIFAIEAEFIHKPRTGAVFSTALIILMVTANISGMIYMDGFEDSLEYMENWIADNIEAGSTIYVGGYCPVVDKNVYDVRVIGYVVPKLGVNEYYIDSSYGIGRYLQQKDYYFCKGDYMYPDLAEDYKAAISNLQLVCSAQTAFDACMHNDFRLKYVDFLTKSHDSYFKGPTLNLYRGK